MEKFTICCLLVIFLTVLVPSGISHQIKSPIREEDREQWMHPTHKFANKNNGRQNPVYENATFWKEDAQSRLRNKVQAKFFEAKAKNVIFYLGDGMSVPTVAAARIFKGQKVDNLRFGEEAELHMDTFPYTGTSKTFCTDSQVADSACSATAYLCGTKANTGTAGVTPAVTLGDCNAQANPENHVSSVLAWAQAEGKSTGIVTTTRVTHASPSGTFSHIAHRDWENDAVIRRHGQDPSVCSDIAKQLILNEPGSKMNVILGGGRSQFTPTTVVDPEPPNYAGFREDGVNLIDTWKAMKNESKASYVMGRDELLAINTAETDYLLGLFDSSHVAYLDEQPARNDPSLEEMVEVAVQILSKNPKGFFLFVEGGRIDHAHHDNMITRALWETVEFDKAIQKGDNMTSDDDTLIVITSDHAHVMFIAGYPDRGNPILKFSGEMANDSLPYATLGYGNGPGPAWYYPDTGTRYNVSGDDPDVPGYRAPSPVPMSSETHGGDDVLIFAKGPYAHLFTGTHQQSYIPHAIGYAACLGEGAKSEHCGTPAPGPNAAISVTSFGGMSFILVAILAIFLC